MIKKKFLMLVTASALVAGMASCKKEEMAPEVVAQTVSQTLKAGETYTFVLPGETNGKPYKIKTEAGHAAVSEVGTNSAGEMVYRYTPVEAYTGTDQVVVTNLPPKPTCGNKPPRHPRKPHKEGCNAEPKKFYEVTINFVVEKEEIATR